MAQLIPNLLSVARLVLGLVFPLAPQSWWLALVLIGGLSDVLDGEASRLLHATSKAGRILDPVADKVFVVSVLLTLLASGVVELWQLALVGLRDIAVAIGAAWIGLSRGMAALGELRPSLAGKAATAGQFVFLAAALVADRMPPVILAVSTTLSAWAAIDYWFRYGRSPKPNGSQKPGDSRQAPRGSETPTQST